VIFFWKGGWEWKGREEREGEGGGKKARRVESVEELIVPLAPSLQKKKLLSFSFFPLLRIPLFLHASYKRNPAQK